MTPRLNVSHWGARTSSASVPLVTEEMDVTVTVQSPADNIWCLIFIDIVTACVPKRFRVLCIPRWSSSPSPLGDKVEGFASVLHHHLPIYFSSPRPLPQLILHLIRTCSVSS